MRKNFVLLFTVLLIFSCGEETEITTNEKQVRSNLAAGSQSEEELKAAAEKRRAEQEERERERLSKLTTMEVLPAEFNFGRIPKEKPVSKVFEIKNTGDKPLIIEDAQASCGCTVPKKPEEPILPGQSGELEVTFTSKPDQAGQSIRKTVTITANIPSMTQVITVSGQVDE
jgi:hypothetical protein